VHENGTEEEIITAQGHTGFIESVSGAKIKLWGAHKSLGAVGSKSYNLDDWNNCWAARPEK
jgi:hypothetical protein